MLSPAPVLVLSGDEPIGGANQRLFVAAEARLPRREADENLAGVEGDRHDWHRIDPPPREPTPGKLNRDEPIEHTARPLAHGIVALAARIVEQGGNDVPRRLRIRSGPSANRDCSPSHDPVGGGAVILRPPEPTNPFLDDGLTPRIRTVRSPAVAGALCPRGLGKAPSLA